jgi:acyl CoA:acetate/3-ketoacid CoA transferase beta subunit
MIITDRAVFTRDSRSEPYALVELAPGVSGEEVRVSTEANYLVRM